MDEVKKESTRKKVSRSSKITSKEVAEHGKIQPQAVDLEEAVLGAMMLEKDAVSAVIDILSPAVFYKESHKRIMTSIASLFSKSEPIDILTVTNELKSTGDLEMVGGPYYITMLTSRIASTANVEYHARIILQKHIQRELIRISSEIIKDAFEDTTDVFDLLDRAEQNLFAVSESNLRRNFEDMPSLIKQAILDIENAKNADEHMRGVPSGYVDIDRITSGWQKSDLIILAARPSMGKTAFAMNLVENAILDQDQPVLVFSLEMPAESLIFRMLSSIGRLDQGKLRTGQLTDDDWPGFNNAVKKLKDRPLYIDDSAGVSPMEMRSRARRIKREHGALGMIVVDYLQLMQIKGSTEGRVNEISEISRSLKLLAREFECPVIALSQLNRGLEQRPNKRPVMSDLRESGAIEQDADVIAFIYRDEVYNEDTPDKGVAEVIIGKQRNGPIGTVRLSFLGQFTRFENFTQARYDDSYTHGM